MENYKMKFYKISYVTSYVTSSIVLYVGAENSRSSLNDTIE